MRELISFLAKSSNPHVATKRMIGEASAVLKGKGLKGIYFMQCTYFKLSGIFLVLLSAIAANLPECHARPPAPALFMTVSRAPRACHVAKYVRNARQIATSAGNISSSNRRRRRRAALKIAFS